MRIRPSLRAPWYQKELPHSLSQYRAANESPIYGDVGALLRHVDLGQCRALAFNFGKTSEGDSRVRSASGNGFDSSDSFAVPALPRGRTPSLTYPRAFPSHGDDSHLLSRIASPADVKALAPNELAELCREIRTTLLAYGPPTRRSYRLQSGMVEATVALHRVFGFAA